MVYKIIFMIARPMVEFLLPKFKAASQETQQSVEEESPVPVGEGASE